jgi:hypothetical protein
MEKVRQTPELLEHLQEFPYPTFKVRIKVNTTKIALQQSPYPNLG